MATRATEKTKATGDRWVEARRRLETLLAHLERRSARVERDLGRADEPLAKDFEEQAQVRENDEVLAALATEGQDQLLLVRTAIERLNEGTYGICSKCEGPISADRLEALPYAALCIGCASKVKAEELWP